MDTSKTTSVILELQKTANSCSSKNSLIALQRSITGRQLHGSCKRSAILREYILFTLSKYKNKIPTRCVLAGMVLYMFW